MVAGSLAIEGSRSQTSSLELVALIKPRRAARLELSESSLTRMVNMREVVTTMNLKYEHIYTHHLAYYIYSLSEDVCMPCVQKSLATISAVTF
jgi:hypothetical protein